LVLPRASTDGMNQFLAELSSQVPPRTHALVLIDNAGWHVGVAVPDASKVTLREFSVFNELRARFIVTG
jgi:hypothetical protein